MQPVEKVEIYENNSSQWADLPELVMKKVLLCLKPNDRYSASLVCRNWNYVFNTPKIWETFTLNDNTLTRYAVSNYDNRIQQVLDYERAKKCLNHIGHQIKHLKLQPVTNFSHLYQFMMLLTWHLTQNESIECKDVDEKYVGSKIKVLTYIYPCNIAIPYDPYGAKVFGIEGQLLNALKQLLSTLQRLETLKLIDLVLERYQANHLFDTIHKNCLATLKALHIINVTTVHCPILDIGLFLNLQILVISPQNVSDKTLEILENSRLLDLYLLQNEYTPQNIVITPCSSKAWKNLHEKNQQLRVHLHLDVSRNKADLLLQPNAPVHSVTYNTPRLRLTPEMLQNMTNSYKSDLNRFVQQSIAKTYCSRSFRNRIDEHILMMVKNCSHIETLIISEKISTCTILLIATLAKNLKYFYVRKNAVLLRCDWRKSEFWSNEFYKWLQTTSHSYDGTEVEISKILKKSWSLLTDRQYKDVTMKHGL